MIEPRNNELIADLTRDVIAHKAPQELPLFRALCEAYFERPDKVLACRPPKDDMLGFGVGEVVTYLTPVALAVVTEVLKYLGEQVASDAVKRLFKKFRSAEQAGPQSPPPLSQEQMIRIRQIVLERARQLRLSEDQSGVLADAVISSLATAP
jgi:hypothetical protein